MAAHIKLENKANDFLKRMVLIFSPIRQMLSNNSRN